MGEHHRAAKPSELIEYDQQLRLAVLSFREPPSLEVDGLLKKQIIGGGPVPDILGAAVEGAREAIVGRWREPAEHAAALAFHADVRHRFRVEAATLRASSFEKERAFGEVAAAFIDALPAALTRHLTYVERLKEQTATRSVSSDKERAAPPPMIRREVERSR